MASIVFERVGKRYADGFAAVQALDLKIAEVGRGLDTPTRTITLP